MTKHSQTAPLGMPGSHRRQTVDAAVDVFHRLAADGYVLEAYATKKAWHERN